MAANITKTITYEFTNFKTCIYLPPRVHSEIPWFNTTGSGMIVENSLPVLQMQMCVIFFATVFFKSLLCRLGIPNFTSMSIVGLMLATTFNDNWAARRKLLFFLGSQENLGLLADFGYMFFMFYIGVKTDMSVVLKTRRKATYIGSIAIVVPFLFSLIVLKFYSSRSLELLEATKLGIIIGLFSITPFPVISLVLSDLKILNSELGRLGQSSALVSDLFNIFTATVLAIVKLYYDHSILMALKCMTAAILFILLVMFVLRPAMYWIIKQTPEGSQVSDHYVYTILIIALFAAYVTNRLGFFALFGPFILGLSIPEGPPLGTAIIRKIDTFVNGILMPLFVTTCAMRVDLNDLMDWKKGKGDGELDQFMVQTLVIIAVNFVVKFVGCMIPPLYSDMPLNDAISLALIMSSKGIVEMAAFSLVRDSLQIPDNVFALIMMCIIINATVVPMLLGALYDPMKKYAGYTKRNLTDLRSNTELRILSCIYRTYNIPQTINLLEATYPTKQEPICAYVLQLIELIGRATPVFVCHQLQTKKKPNTNTSMAEKVLESFQNLEIEFKGSLIVNTFTAISPSEMMYDDICTLALDKYTSLIVLPFHKKWSSDGDSIELEDETLRDLNYLVMERAPCSVGVLIEKAQITHVFSSETPYNVCLIFIGGKDDREAFFFAKRMTKNPHVRLTIVRFLVSGESKSWQSLLDNELLNDIKIENKVGDAHVSYIEENVKDGPETALVIRNLVSGFDLVIVGRQDGVETPQTSGLLQWSEYPELGVLGDLLASTDAAGNASVFVIQQQRTAKDIL